jgi:hypothetical protein
MPWLLMLWLVCVQPLLAHAQSVTFDFGQPQTWTATAEDQEALTRLLQEINRQRAESRPPLPAWTIEDWQIFVLSHTMAAYHREVQALYAQDGCAVFRREASEDTKAAILPHFGGKSPCPDSSGGAP